MSTPNDFQLFSTTSILDRGYSGFIAWWRASMNVGEPLKRRHMFSLVENIIELQLQVLGYNLSSATNFKFTYCKLLSLFSI